MTTNKPSVVATALVDEVATRLEDELPAELIAPSVRGRVALWVATRSLARLRTIGLLIRVRQLDDAVILLRPLLSDSERLQYVASRPPSDRDALMVSWVDHALNECDVIALAADRSGESAFAAAIRQMVATERRGLDTARPANRVPLPAEGLNLMRE